jgi:hypothetical protein
VSWSLLRMPRQPVHHLLGTNYRTSKRELADLVAGTIPPEILLPAHEMEVAMPDEKIDRKRPAHAENEPKPLQQRHVDDAVDDSFPASDPPAWTTSASKSVAAECEPDELKEAPIRSGQGLELQAGDTTRSRAEQTSGLARDLYGRGQAYVEQGRRHWPEAERYYRQGTRPWAGPCRSIRSPLYWL